MMISYIMIGVGVLAAVLWLLWRHQRSLKRRAELMQEAIRNRDFTFRLPTNGLLPGERAMQESLNQLGTLVQQQVNAKEVESWERLTRVLTHEIMNATAPIASLSQSLLSHPDVKGTPLEEAVRAINTTSHHLNTFVDSYRKFSHLQQPDIREVALAPLVDELRLLFPAIAIHADLAEGVVVRTDPTMLRQVLINLTKNAQEAGATSLSIVQSQQVLKVSNNGAPIPPEVRQSIFVPFFTTRRTGSGIGLSLSRRMMIQQGGGLELSDRPLGGYHTTFVLQFP